ncbi:MAG: exo-alpha-sialidase [Armatimonadetes bacterium]|nr:exo-alpha-sialidase [Armatimonadota bacterium]MDE2205161.1 exo-alpha-sialidase [Armatimonadota bacterium]
MDHYLAEFRSFGRRWGFVALTALLLAPAGGQTLPRVICQRLQSGAIQPQSAVDSSGRVHVVFYRGPAQAGNLYYERLAQDGAVQVGPIRVNSVPGTALATGTVRAAQIAVGRGGAVYVAFNGLGPKSAAGYPEMYEAFTRIPAGGSSFLPQRNLVSRAGGLDGGGSVAADGRGNVWVAWHALAGARSEARAGVWLAHSHDDGITFSPEHRIDPGELGACGCCGMRMLAGGNGLLAVLYRTARAGVERDTMLLVSHDDGASFSANILDRWRISACPMSTYSLLLSAGRLFAAWETHGQVRMARIGANGRAAYAPVGPASDSARHPVLAAAPDGTILLAWAQGSGWEQGGSVGWQLYRPDGTPLGAAGSAAGLPVWGIATGWYDGSSGFRLLW